jgi:hypothetical protein
MTDEIIGMYDMIAIYEVTDRFGIDRESISVPLEKEGGGNVLRKPDGAVEIVAPATMPTRDWLPSLHAKLERLGFVPAEGDEEPWD